MPTGLVSGEKSFPSCLPFVTSPSVFLCEYGQRERERHRERERERRDMGMVWGETDDYGRGCLRRECSHEN